MALAEFNVAKHKGTATVRGYIKDRAGNLQPVWKVRAGDRVVITDIVDEEVHVVTETDYGHDDKTAQARDRRHVSAAGRVPRSIRECSSGPGPLGRSERVEHDDGGDQDQREEQRDCGGEMGGFHAGHDHGATLMADIDDTEQVLDEMEGLENTWNGRVLAAAREGDAADA